MNGEVRIGPESFSSLSLLKSRELLTSEASRCEKCGKPDRGRTQKGKRSERSRVGVSADIVKSRLGESWEAMNHLR